MDPTKNSDDEVPIPEVWRPVFADIVQCLIRGDFQLKDVVSVEPVSPETAHQMDTYVAEYGVDLVGLTEETWGFSACRWRQRHGRWDVLVNLQSAEEGLSDLTLRARVYESLSGYRFEVEGISVP